MKKREQMSFHFFYGDAREGGEVQEELSFYK